MRFIRKPCFGQCDAHSFPCKFKSFLNSRLRAVSSRLCDYFRFFLFCSPFYPPMPEPIRTVPAGLERASSSHNYIMRRSKTTIIMQQPGVRALISSVEVSPYRTQAGTRSRMATLRCPKVFAGKDDCRWKSGARCAARSMKPATRFIRRAADSSYHVLRTKHQLTSSRSSHA